MGVGVGVLDRALDAGPKPLGTYVLLLVSTTLSTTNPSSRIQRLTVWAPGVVTLIDATTPSSVDLDHPAEGRKLLTRSLVDWPPPSSPAWMESSPPVAPT